MDFNIRNRVLFFVWGFALATGWTVSYYLHEMMSSMSLTVFWTVLMSMPVIVSVKWMTQHDSSSLPAPWILTAAIGVGFSFAVIDGYVMIPELQNYAVFWFFLPAMAFAATTYYFDGVISQMYTGVALINFIVAGSLLFNTEIMQQHYAIAGVTQALPMLYHAYIYEA